MTRYISHVTWNTIYYFYLQLDVVISICLLFVTIRGITSSSETAAGAWVELILSVSGGDQQWMLSHCKWAAFSPRSLKVFAPSKWQTSALLPQWPVQPRPSLNHSPWPLVARQLAATSPACLPYTGNLNALALSLLWLSQVLFENDWGKTIYDWCLTQKD